MVFRPCTLPGIVKRYSSGIEAAVYGSSFVPSVRKAFKHATTAGGPMGYRSLTHLDRVGVTISRKYGLSISMELNHCNSIAVVITF